MLTSLKVPALSFAAASNAVALFPFAVDVDPCCVARVSAVRKRRSAAVDIPSVTGVSILSGVSAIAGIPALAGVFYFGVPAVACVPIICDTPFTNGAVAIFLTAAVSSLGPLLQI